ADTCYGTSGRACCSARPCKSTARTGTCTGGPGSQRRQSSLGPAAQVARALVVEAVPVSVAVTLPGCLALPAAAGAAGPRADCHGPLPPSSSCRCGGTSASAVRNEGPRPSSPSGSCSRRSCRSSTRPSRSYAALASSAPSVLVASLVATLPVPL